jgi:hypothetical protein
LLGNVAAAAAAAADSRQEFALVLGFSPMVFNQYEEKLNMIIPKLKIPLNRCFLILTSYIPHGYIKYLILVINDVMLGY